MPRGEPKIAAESRSPPPMGEQNLLLFAHNAILKYPPSEL
jgi:hypothetical protein